MRAFRFCIAVVIVTVSFVTVNLNANQELSDTEKALFSEMMSLDWKDPGTYKLSQSRSNLVVPEGHIVVVDEDARKFECLSSGEYDSDIEAIVICGDFNDEIRFSCCNEGYVSLSDWSDVDAKQLLKGISENTEAANIERKKKGLSQLHVIGWVQEPTLDKQTNTVFWAIEGYAENDENTIVNSIALRLGRKGFERVVWITDKNSYTPFGGELDVMLRSHSFDPGYRYNDFSTGDKVATYGIATLVAATVGGKIVKAGGILLVFKKLWGFLFAGLGALLYKAKKIFRRSSND